MKIKPVMSGVSGVSAYSIWALLSLGTTELILILTNPIYFLLLTFVCSCLFSLYVYHLFPGKNSALKISKSLLLSTVILILCKFLFIWLIILEVSTALTTLHFISVIIYFVGGFISGNVFLKFSNGAN
jgi:hypothetical protein